MGSDRVLLTFKIMPVREEHA